MNKELTRPQESRADIEQAELQRPVKVMYRLYTRKSTDESSERQVLSISTVEAFE